ncbi:MAG TPA: SH3 domain-containing protein [Roseiflexaceae bacterium]|nr:SH3 domain-containing protein [Roseiflexaceae bacterium]
MILLIALILIGAVVVGAIAFVVMRNRRAGADVMPPPEISQPIDYTSLPIEEPTTFGDRLRNMPAATKLLIGVIGLAVVVALAVLYFAFLEPTQTAGSPTPTLPPPEITEVQANVAGPTKILIDAKTNLPDGSQVTASMQEDGQEFVWFDPQTASVEVDGGNVRLIVEKQNSGGVPKSDASYTITLTGTSPTGQTVTSEPAAVDVPRVYQAAFFQVTTPTPEPPTPTPTQVLTATQVVTPTPETTPTVAPPALSATVFNGGNVREQPNLNGRVLDQINANENVSLLEKTANGQWYRITNVRGVSGWVSATLLRIDAPVAAQVPVQGQAQPTTAAPPPTPAPSTPPASGLTASVFNGGNVREQPNLNGRVLDQINANETVVLLAKTANGQWYRITNVRGVSGWVSATLLRVNAQVAAQVPVAP